EVNNPYFTLHNPAYGLTPTLVLVGARTPFAPELTANVGAAYTFHVSEMAGNPLTITPRIDLAYKSHSYAQLFQNPSTRLPAETLVTLAARFESAPWWASVWVTNVADKRSPGAKQTVGVAPPNAFFGAPHIVGIVYMAPPRLFGARVGRSF